MRHRDAEHTQLPGTHGLLSALCLCGYALLLPPCAAAEAVPVSDAASLQRALASAKAGHVILIAPGDYRGIFAASNLHGTPREPVVIAAADPARPPVFYGRRECIHLSGVSHVVLRDLVLTNARYNGLNIDDAYDALVRSLHWAENRGP